MVRIIFETDSPAYEVSRPYTAPSKLYSGAPEVQMSTRKRGRDVDVDQALDQDVLVTPKRPRRRPVFHFSPSDPHVHEQITAFALLTPRIFDTQYISFVNRRATTPRQRVAPPDILVVGAAPTEVTFETDLESTRETMVDGKTIGAHIAAAAPDEQELLKQAAYQNHQARRFGKAGIQAAGTSLSWGALNLGAAANALGRKIFLRGLAECLLMPFVQHLAEQSQNRLAILQMIQAIETDEADRGVRLLAVIQSSLEIREVWQELRDTPPGRARVLLIARIHASQRECRHWVRGDNGFHKALGPFGDEVRNALGLAVAN